MKKRKIVSLLLVMVFTLSLVLAGCSGKKNEGKTDTNDSGNADVTKGASTAVSHDDLLTLDVYDVAANYQGKQAGWFGKILKDKFNIELNIIAPQVSGDGKALYQTRTSSGNLGDIIILDNADLQDCIKAGLISDLTSDLPNYKNLNDYSEQIKTYNSGLEDNTDGKLYGIPCNMTNTDPSTFSDTTLYSSPLVPWDYYSELGNPEIKDLEGLLDVMEKMQKAHPKNDKGDPNYALSLWSDWDGTSIETVNQITKWYGYEVNGSILLGNKGDMMELTDDAGAYYKMLHFFYEANQRGLVDPDSGTQDWETACTKMKNKQVLLFWYSWQCGFWNTIDRANENNAYIYAPVKDMNFYQTSDTYYGDGRAWAVGSKVEGEKKARVMELLDWLASPEGLTYNHDGLKDFNYTVGDDGKYTLTKDGENALMQNLDVPAEYGGGGYSDGNNKINQTIVSSNAIDPTTGEYYNTTKWSTYVEANKTKMTKEWAAKYGAENEVEYLKKSGQLEVVPSVNKILTSDSTDIALIRSQCGQLICDTSWKMIFASNENEFKKMWSELKTQLEGLGWKQLVEFDKTKYQVIVDARKAATK